MVGSVSLISRIPYYVLVAASIVWYGSVNFVIMLMGTLLAELDCKELHLSAQSIKRQHDIDITLTNTDVIYLLCY